MSGSVDDKFYDRADAHIHLSNEQLADINRGKVSASMLYATARFGAWLTACESSSANEMEEKRAERIAFFVEQYRLMLEENLEDYIQNFDQYMAIQEKP